MPWRVFQDRWNMKYNHLHFYISKIIRLYFIIQNTKRYCHANEHRREIWNEIFSVSLSKALFFDIFHCGICFGTQLTNPECKCQSCWAINKLCYPRCKNYHFCLLERFSDKSHLISFEVFKYGRHVFCRPDFVIPHFA